MIELGKINTLQIIREASPGLYLGDGFGDEVLLPNKFNRSRLKIGDSVEVFVYNDSEDRPVATLQTPKIRLHEFALLQTKTVNKIGAFMDWGLDKDLLVPFREQPQELIEGRWYIVFLDLDEETDRLFGSNRIERYLQNDNLLVENGDEVDLIVYHISDLGYTVAVNNIHRGLVYKNEVFNPLRIGDKLKGYVKTIREDGKLDISIRPIGYRQYIDADTQRVMEKLLVAEGFLPFTDKSSPEEIYEAFGMSKKAFKKAIGALYKAKELVILKEGLRKL